MILFMHDYEKLNLIESKINFYENSALEYKKPLAINAD